MPRNDYELERAPPEAELGPSGARVPTPKSAPRRLREPKQTAKVDRTQHMRAERADFVVLSTLGVLEEDWERDY
jgi:hypothetical protein